MEWVGEAEEVAVAGEFNGWVTVPLIKEKVRIGSGDHIFHLGYSTLQLSPLSLKDLHINMQFSLNGPRCRFSV